jgi:hypothetical protein
MEKKKRRLRANELSSISPRFVEDNELHDPPARLYRMLLRKMGMDPFKWTRYLRNYLEWAVPNDNPDRARVERTTRLGNIRDTYFHKPGLTFNKFLEGLSILRIDTCEVIIRVTDEDGKVYEVIDTQKITGMSRPKLEVTEDEKSGKSSKKAK